MTDDQIIIFFTDENNLWCALSLATDEMGIDRYESDPAVIEEAADARMVLIRQYQTGPHAAETQVLLNEISAAKLCLLNPAARAQDRKPRGEVDLAPRAGT